MELIVTVRTPEGDSAEKRMQLKYAIARARAAFEREEEGT